jgi:hypothetical protein
MYLHRYMPLRPHNPQHHSDREQNSKGYDHRAYVPPQYAVERIRRNYRALRNVLSMVLVGGGQVRCGSKQQQHDPTGHLGQSSLAEGLSVVYIFGRSGVGDVSANSSS